MIDQYDAICIFASPRSGSTLLIEQLTTGVLTRHTCQAKAFYEYLSPHNYITKNFECVYLDKEHVMNRPFTNGQDLYRIERLSHYYNSGIFPIFKIFPHDHSVHNRLHIQSHILTNPKIYKVFLNRLDVVNQILSYCIGMSTGVWHTRSTSAALVDRVWRQYHVSHETLQTIGSSIMQHQLWHVENADLYCDRTVWYHELTTIDWPDLGITHTDIELIDLVKNTNDHVNLAKKSLSNFDEVYTYAKMIESNLKQTLVLLS